MIIKNADNKSQRIEMLRSLRFHLNAIMQSGRDNKRWDTLYAIAVKAYVLETYFSEEQARKYAAWRENLLRGLMPMMRRICDQPPLMRY